MESWFFNPTNLTAPDYAVVAVFIGLMFVIGFYAGRKEENTNDFFLGGRRVPAWAACLSFVATEISALTIISVPATAFRENWQYGQFFIGSALSRIAIAFLFIPAFYRYDCTTIYQFLRFRFGQQTQVTASAFFFVTRLLGSGVRLMVAAKAISILVGWHLIPTLLLFTVISIVYIAYGGIKAVVWTNVLQALTFLAGGVATLAFLATRLDGGLQEILRVAMEARKLEFFNWGPVDGSSLLGALFTDPNIVYIAILNGFVGSLAAFGTDHDLMQRLLTVETRRQSQKTILWTILGSFCVIAIFLSVGTGLFVFHAQNPGLPQPPKPDDVFPHFINNVMPALLRGLLLAGILLASIDSPLGSLSASFVTDIYRTLLAPGRDDRHYLAVGRVSVVVFGLILVALAYAFSFLDRFLWLAFKIGGVTFGSLLGVFLLGLTTERRADRANTLAMTASAVTMGALLVLSETKVLPIGWSWLVILGTVMTFSLAYALGPRLEARGAGIAAEGGIG